MENGALRVLIWGMPAAIVIDNYRPSRGALLKPIDWDRWIATMTVLVESDQDAQSTKERIKRGARKLFARHGVDAMTVRDIVRESKVKNASALNYYFGSKEELIQTLIRDALSTADQRLDAALSALEKNGGPTSVRQVIEILVLRVLPPTASDDDQASARLFATLLDARRHIVTGTVRKLGYSSYNRALDHLRRLMQPMPLAVKNQRLLFYFWSSTSILAVLEAALTEKGRFTPPWSAADPLLNLVDSAVGMLEAPHTGRVAHDRTA
jgi:AcrR family transcriptional regulator